MINKKNISIFLIIIILVLISLIFIKKYNNKNLIKLDKEYYKEGKLIEQSNLDINNKLNSNTTFILFVYNNYCTLPISCESIFKETAEKYNISILKITFENFKKTTLYNEVKLAPSIIIIKDGKIVDYLKADKDEDLNKYQDTTEFTNWLKRYIVL